MGGLKIDNTAIKVITIIIIVIILLLYIYKWYKYHQSQKQNVWPPNGPSVCPDYFSYDSNTKSCLNPFQLGRDIDSIPKSNITSETDEQSICSNYDLTWEGVCDT